MNEYLPVGLPVKVSVLQKADRWVFAPICFLLTLVRRARDLFQEKQPVTFRNILLVKLAEQGSTVLATAAIRKAVQTVGKENVYFAVFEENRFILDVMQLIPEKNILTVPTNSIGAMIFGSIRMLAVMRKIGFDVAVDLEFFARFSAAITYLSGAKWRSGMHAYFSEGPYRGDLMTHRVLYNPHLHTTEMFYAMVTALSFPVEVFPTFNIAPQLQGEQPSLFEPSPEETSEVKALVCELTGLSSVPSLILLNPNAGDFLPLRRWPVERYAELASRILQELPQAWVTFTGLASEAAISEQLVRDIDSKRCFSLAGRTNLRQLLVLYTLSEVLVTNDSGPAHFATLTPIHVITLFGPETPNLFAARSPRNLVAYAGIACSPCINALNNRQSACRNNLCMKNITVGDVFQKVCKAYSSRRGSGQA